ncbi:hypothetical protein [Anaerosporobacter sp.]|uniref:hypothetical protein n=1 Tax=Anaerosporobacter sp. TaxID=1872529 RepID=UPI00286F8FE8|nr:hypothetical protein [Anaerosporobacter sp.]
MAFKSESVTQQNPCYDIRIKKIKGGSKMHNLDAVFQSFTDTWLPLVGVVGAVVLVAVVVSIYKKVKKHNS